LTSGSGGLVYTLGTAAALNNCHKWYVANQSVPVMVIDSQGGGNIQLGRSGAVGATYGLSNAMQARVNCIQNTVDTKVLRVQTDQAAGNSVIEDVIQQKITTTNGTPTPTTIQATVTDYTYMVETTVVARRSNGDCASYKLQAHFNNVSGTLTKVSSTLKTIIWETDAALDADLIATGTNIRLEVTGIAAVTYVWHATSRIYFLSA
jgi:hypothetical protein